MQVIKNFVFVQLSRTRDLMVRPGAIISKWCLIILDWRPERTFSINGNGAKGCNIGSKLLIRLCYGFQQWPTTVNWIRNWTKLIYYLIIKATYNSEFCDVIWVSWNDCGSFFMHFSNHIFNVLLLLFFATIFHFPLFFFCSSLLFFTIFFFLSFFFFSLLFFF